MLAKTSTIACGVLGVLFAARVHAQTEDAETKPPDAAAAAADGADQLTLPKGRALIDGYLAINLSDGASFKPVSISPDIWYGATDDITVGLVHSGVGQSGFMGNPIRSLCLTGTENGCLDFYSNVGVDGRYKLKAGGPLVYAADAGLYINHLGDPFQLAIKLGAIGRWHQGQIAVEAAPNLQFGLTNREPAAVNGVAIGLLNGDVLSLPGTVLYALNPMITLAVQTGVLLPFQNTGDTYDIPLSIGGFYHVNESLNVSLTFSLPALVGGGSGTGFDARVLTLGGTYAL
jgi:hypothetical protein